MSIYNSQMSQHSELQLFTVVIHGQDLRETFVTSGIETSVSSGLETFVPLRNPALTSTLRVPASNFSAGTNCQVSCALTLPSTRK